MTTILFLHTQAIDFHSSRWERSLDPIAETPV